PLQFHGVRIRLLGAPFLEQRRAGQGVLQFLGEAGCSARAERQVGIVAARLLRIRQADEVLGHFILRLDAPSVAGMRCKPRAGQPAYSKRCGPSAKPTVSAPLPTLTMPVRLITDSKTCTPCSAHVRSSCAWPGRARSSSSSPP